MDIRLHVLRLTRKGFSPLPPQDRRFLHTDLQKQGRQRGKFSEEGGLEGGRLFQEVPSLQGLSPPSVLLFGEHPAKFLTSDRFCAILFGNILIVSTERIPML